MTTLSGKKADDFLVWLKESQHILPPKMSLAEASELFLRKLKDEEDLKNEG